jgi:hypothetical protein
MVGFGFDVTARILAIGSQSITLWLTAMDAASYPQGMASLPAWPPPGRPPGVPPQKGGLRGAFFSAEAYCERKVAPKSKFDARSFRWKKSGKGRVLVGCPKGKWNAKTERCRVGTKAYAILTPTHTGRCRRGSKPVQMG